MFYIIISLYINRKFNFSGEYFDRTMFKPFLLIKGVLVYECNEKRKTH